MRNKYFNCLKQLSNLVEKCDKRLPLTYMAKSIGIDIGGTNFRIGVFEHLTLLTETRFQANFSELCKKNSPETAWAAIVNCIAKGIETVMVEHQDIQSVGIGFPGFIDPLTKLISESPNLPGLKNVNLKEDLSQALKKQDKLNKIIVENDAVAAAYGEYYMAGKQSPSLLFVGLGTGVGGGLILAGQPYGGEHGMAMEIGHIIVKPNGRPCGCGNHGCVEQYASASAIQISYAESAQQQSTADKIAEFASHGDKAAIAAYALAGESLAIGIAHTLKIVDVTAIVIGGGLSKAWSLMESSFNTTLQANLIPVLRGKPQITVSKFEDKAGMFGAAMLAKKEA